MNSTKLQELEINELGTLFSFSFDFIKFFCLNMHFLLHLDSFCPDSYFSSHLSRREMGLSMIWNWVFPNDSRNCFRTCLLVGILECFWTIPDIGREESCCQKLNPNPRQEKWRETRFHGISLDFQTVKYQFSSVHHCLGAYVQISQVLFFQV